MVNNKINVNVIDGLQPILDRIIDYDNITNCITEIPQDIKLELVDGVLTLKAGSKVYVPNGAGKFDEVVISGDKTVTGFTTGADNVQFLLFINSINQSPYCFRVQDCYSGSTAPTATAVGNMMWYDTSNNIIRNSADQGSTWGNIWGLPLAVVTASNKVVTSIDQVFNGFGYIGSTVFALPGVKGLIPNGRNEDGSLKNVEFVSTTVTTKTIPSTSSVSNGALICNKGMVLEYTIWLGELDEDPATTVDLYSRYYNRKLNVVRFLGGSRTWTNQGDYGQFALASSSSGAIATLTPKLPFRAVDQNDFNKLDEEVATLDAQNVKLTGNQTVSGSKNFTNTIKSNHNLALESKTNVTTFEKPAEAPTEAKNIGRINFSSSDSGYSMGHLVTYRNTSNAVATQILARQSINGVQKSCALELVVDKDGNAYTKAPTPPTTDNSTQIATTAWVNNKHQVVTALPSSPTAGVFYFIKE